MMVGWVVEQEAEGRKGQAEALELADSSQDNKWEVMRHPEWSHKGSVLFSGV